MLHALHPDTVVRWHREGFRRYWHWKSRRQVVHFNVTEHPTAHWTAQQLVEAFPFETAPHYLLQVRDCIYGETVRRQINSLGMENVIKAPRSPWQN